MHDEAEENNLKTNFIKMIDTLKEEMKNSLTDIEKKMTKNSKKSINPFKKAMGKKSNR